MSEIPTWDGFMVPVLEVLSDGEPRTAKQVRERVSDHVGLTPEQRAEMLKSGQPRSGNRINWATSFLTRAEALSRPKRATYVITEAGQRLLQEHPDVITEKHLKQIPAYVDHVPASYSASGSKAKADFDAHASLDPVEQIDAGVQRVHDDVAAQLLKALREQDPDFLEQAVLDVLVAMGYGGAEQRARLTSGGADSGVDGVIDQDALGLARIYVQAKRYAVGNVVGRPKIQGFVGALQGHQAHQGVFITTSSFSKEAVDYAAGVSASVVLIDGEQLARLMIRYGVGVQNVQTYTVVEVDEDFFT